MGDALPRIGLVLLLGGAEDGELCVAAIDQVGIGHQSAKGLVAPLERGVFEQNFGERFGMRVEQFDAFAAAARHGLRLGFLHGVQHRVEQVERDHDQDSGERIGALEFPRDPRRVARKFVRARLRVDAVRLDITREADVPHRVRVGIGILEVRTVARIRVDEDNLRACLEARADGLGERVGWLDRDIDCLILARTLIRIDDDGDFGEARNRAQPGGLERDGQFQGDHIGAVAQDGSAYFDGEFQASRVRPEST